MNSQFTKQLAEWLSLPEGQRDYQQGALMLLQLNRNQIMYRRVSANVNRHKETISYNLRKYYNQRVADATHEEVKMMAKQADAIVASRALDREKSSKSFEKGKRPDHDSLPDDIKALYVENLDLLHRMREVHLRLRMLSDDSKGEYCPDSDRFPFLKELIALDKKYRANWHAYDTFELAAGQSTMALDSRDESKKYLRLVNLNKGKYAKNHSETLGAQIKDWYLKIASPTVKLTKELTDLGIL